MTKKQTVVLTGVLAFVALVAGAAWLASSHIESPADAAARAAPPAPSPILVPVEERVLRSKIVTRGTARFGLPQPIATAPSRLKTDRGLITTLPSRNSQLNEGDVILTISGRPVFLLQGKLPSHRDLVPGLSGKDVLQLELGLSRLGIDPGLVDGIYDADTSAGVEQWYKAKGFEPFGLTKTQASLVRSLQNDFNDAQRNKLAANASVTEARAALFSARKSMKQSIDAATAEYIRKRTELRELQIKLDKDLELLLEAAQAKAEFANAAAQAELTDQINQRALIVLDPRQPESARRAADAKLKLAEAAAHKARLESTLSTRTAERASMLATKQIEAASAAASAAKAAIELARLDGKKTIRAAANALKIAELDSKLATDRLNRIASDLRKTTRDFGIQVPADEIVFVPSLPIRVKKVFVTIGAPATGELVSVTDNQLVIDSSLPLEAAPLVKVGMQVEIDEQTLGIKTKGVIQRIAGAPGTHGVDGYHVYFEVRVNSNGTQTPLEGVSLRLTIPIKSTKGLVKTVPVSAVSLSMDGTSKIQIDNDGNIEPMPVKVGLSADGYVEVTPIEGNLTTGQLVVVGYHNPDDNFLE